MQPPSPYEIRTKPSRNGARPPPDQGQTPPDKRRPHMAIPEDEVLQFLNGHLRFQPSPCPTGEDSDDDQATEGPLVLCRHLALQYCQLSLDDPKVRPQALFDQHPIAQADPDWLDVRDMRIALFSRHVHLLPSHRLGDFLAQTFTEMIDAAQAPPRHAPDGSLSMPWRVYYATTLHHAMALRLKVKARPEGRWECVVHFYDPNQSNQQVSCRAPSPRDFAEHPQDYHLLAFLVHDEMDQADRDLVQSYFPAIDGDHHIQLYELRNLQTPQDAPASWRTNWCTLPRVGLYSALDAELADEIGTCLLTLLPDDPALVDPASLDALPQVDDSLLHHAMHAPSPRALLAWERVWATLSIDRRVGLLRGLSRRGEHVLERTAQLPDHALQHWCRLAASLPTEALRQAIAGCDPAIDPAIDPSIGPANDPPLICALRQLDARLIRPLVDLIDQATANAPQEAARLLQAHASDGSSAMEVGFRDAGPSNWHTWLDRVARLRQDDALPLLAGLDRHHDPLWARLLAELDLKALARLARVYETEWPASACGAACLALPQTSALLWALREQAQEHPKMFEACARFIGPWLPADTVSDLNTLCWS